MKYLLLMILGLVMASPAAGWADEWGEDLAQSLDEIDGGASEAAPMETAGTAALAAVQPASTGRSRPASTAAYAVVQPARAGGSRPASEEAPAEPAVMTAPVEPSGPATALRPAKAAPAVSEPGMVNLESAEAKARIDQLERRVGGLESSFRYMEERIRAMDRALEALRRRR